jgi:hypothetical protein
MDTWDSRKPQKHLPNVLTKTAPGIDRLKYLSNCLKAPVGHLFLIVGGSKLRLYLFCLYLRIYLYALYSF